MNGQAKIDFEKWYYKNDNGLLYNLDEIPDLYENALIIEWFDSVDTINFQEILLEEFKNYTLKMGNLILL